MSHIINEFSIKPNPDKVKTILQLKEPKNKKEIQKLIGMSNYFKKSILRMTDIVSLKETIKKCIVGVKP